MNLLEQFCFSGQEVCLVRKAAWSRIFEEELAALPLPLRREAAALRRSMTSRNRAPDGARF